MSVLRVVDGLGPEAGDQWPKVRMEANLKKSKSRVVSMGPILFNVLNSDVGSGTVVPSASWQEMEWLRDQTVVPPVRESRRVSVKVIS